MDTNNPLGLRGISFVEFASDDPSKLHALFTAFGFSRVAKHSTRAIDLYRQNDIVFLLNRDANSVGSRFAKVHGPSIASMGWRFDAPVPAVDGAVARGAKRATEVDLLAGSAAMPAIYGIGDSLLYFVDAADKDPFATMGFVPHDEPVLVKDKGFAFIDHLTNNVYKGTMDQWAAFYKSIFGFTEVRYFDIRGVKTGLTSYALRSPDGSFCIPINEADEKKSQINEYLDEYKGPGVQHLAFATKDILGSLAALEGAPIEFLDIENGYYDTVFDRVKNVREDRAEIAKRNVLVDGDDDGYLLQIFTKNLVGPIFIELIQRENNLSFGEGNFGALFRSIERDQMKRGVFADKGANA
ncbi:MAG: 4-hydroxyphenylpyruvate dioxygenase [Myxococcales bacterium]|nr:4-hydroxyphenylpyruvate dioxygenase [Myxococcales bacterium]